MPTALSGAADCAGKTGTGRCNDAVHPLGMELAIVLFLGVHLPLNRGTARDDPTPPVEASRPARR